MALAHYIADAHDNPADSLAGKHRALTAILGCTDADVARQSSSTSRIAAFLPSAHANLGFDDVKVGDFDRAKEHLGSARSLVGELADDSYGQNIRRWIDQLAQEIAGREAPSSPGGVGGNSEA